MYDLDESFLSLLQVLLKLQIPLILFLFLGDAALSESLLSESVPLRRQI